MARENNNATFQEDQSKLNQKQYDILKRCSEKQNISEWNSYCAEQPEIRIHLQNADLRGARLEGAKLTGANLAGARFEGADLLAADLRNADLRRANLEKVNLWGAALSEANLEEACLVSANLENADLRGANLEKANLWGANLEGTIVETAILETAIEDSQPGLKEKIEVVVNLADDITYEELVNLLKCLEGLSLTFGGSLPHLNEVQICRHIDQPVKGHAAWQETRMNNSISVDIPKNVAENIQEVFLWRVAAGQTINDGAEAQIATCMKNSEGCDQLREFLASAGFSENERNTDFASRILPDMEKDGIIEDLWAVANLFEYGRIQFRHRSN
ncbi:MAG: hypothetical protein CEE38_19070 [Planctomycetes bacterium B3_Pla]|nr:MAG: hypothetical protein CEE38_19070 [Planctomycetes bacterium B3_Pla]